MSEKEKGETLWQNRKNCYLISVHMQQLKVRNELNV